MDAQPQRDRLDRLALSTARCRRAGPSATAVACLAVHTRRSRRGRWPTGRDRHLGVVAATSAAGPRPRERRWEGHTILELVAGTPPACVPPTSSTQYPAAAQLVCVEPRTTALSIHAFAAECRHLQQMSIHSW